jgi:hypothetical protein
MVMAAPGRDESIAAFENGGLMFKMATIIHHTPDRACGGIEPGRSS